MTKTQAKLIDRNAPVTPPNNPTFGYLTLTKPGIWQTAYNGSTHSRQSSWGWHRMSDVNNLFYSKEFLKHGPDKSPEPLSMAVSAHTLCAQFGLLMGGYNLNDGGGFMNYLVLDETANTYETRYNIPCDKAGILALTGIDPYLLFVPAGWIETILLLTRRGIERVDRTPPPWPINIPRQDQMLFGHSSPGTNQAHFVVYKVSGTWRWDTFYLPKALGR